MASVIPGAVSRAEVLQDVDWMGLPIPVDLWAELKHEGLMREDAPAPAGVGAQPGPSR